MTGAIYEVGSMWELVAARAAASPDGVMLIDESGRTVTFGGFRHRCEIVAAGLQAEGVRFERFGFCEQDALGIWTAPTGEKVAWFKDPDGNILSVSQHV